MLFVGVDKREGVIKVTAFFTLAAATNNSIFIIISLLPAILFCGLDAYYLWQERLYRALYDDLRLSSTNVNASKVEPFLFSTNNYKAQVTPWYKTWFSPTIFVFHGGVVTAICCVLLFFVRISSQHI